MDTKLMQLENGIWDIAIGDIPQQSEASTHFLDFTPMVRTIMTEFRVMQQRISLVMTFETMKMWLMRVMGFTVLNFSVRKLSISSVNPVINPSSCTLPFKASINPFKYLTNMLASINLMENLTKRAGREGDGIQRFDLTIKSATMRHIAFFSLNSV